MRNVEISVKFGLWEEYLNFIRVFEDNFRVHPKKENR